MSSNPRNQATIQDDRVTGNYTVGQPRVVKCYNYQGEGHMARQCTQPKRTRNSTWFKEKLMLAEAQEASQILDEVQLAFLADPRMDEAPVSHQKIPQNSAFQTKDLDAYNSDCDDISSTKAEIDALKETLSNNVKEKESLSKTLTVFKIESKENESKYIDKEVVLEKQNKEVENIICKMYRSTQAMHMLTKPHVFYNDTHKQALGYQNPFYLKKAQRIKPTLYDGSVIAKEHVVISVIDDEETLILEEESRLKILDKQNDPLSIEKKINISQINYSKLNKIKEDFGKRFVSQKELSAEQAFWLKHSNHSFDTSDKSHTPVRIEAPSELPKMNAELLVYVSKTCLNLRKPSEKLVAVTPINKDKRVRFTEPVTSSSNIPKQTDPLKTKDSNKPFVTSTGVKYYYLLVTSGVKAF
ncbi:retrovirus-related pol polyprotein from transposon TNT 1-94 [Tanacetum coccineum]